MADGSILPEIRLEVGVLASWNLLETREISSYVAQKYGRLFTQPTTTILMVKPEQTFWEKATILHREANRINGNFPQRYSRHYYDLYRLSKSEVKGIAFKDFRTLKDVVEFKDKFYHCSWAKYSDCLNGNFRLIPDKKTLEKINLDYVKMQNMLFGIKPSINEIIECLKNLETEINGIYLKNGGEMGI